jgi:hypothetical protein
MEEQGSIQSVGSASDGSQRTPSDRTDMSTPYCSGITLLSQVPMDVMLYRTTPS